MKKIVSLIMCLCSVYANSQEGIPFFVNYPASVYQAHNRNFDVVCDSCGNVYFANFEGILHYDYSRWETIYTPGFSRVTRLFRDSEGRIWVGGYHVFGRIERDGRGCITLRTLLSDLDTNFLGELEDMAEIDKRIYLKATSGGYYTVQSDSILAPVQVLPAQLQEKWRNQHQTHSQLFTHQLPSSCQITEQRGYRQPTKQTDQPLQYCCKHFLFHLYSNLYYFQLQI